MLPLQPLQAVCLLLQLLLAMPHLLLVFFCFQPGLPQLLHLHAGLRSRDGNNNSNNLVFKREKAMFLCCLGSRE